MSVMQPVVPILSIRSVTLFPHALLELNLANENFGVGAGEWLTEGAIWGIATLRGDPGDMTDGGFLVPVFRTVGIGCIVHRECVGGRIRRLVLEGLVRGRLVSELPTLGASPVRVEILHDHVNIEGSHRKELAEAFGSLVRTARRVGDVRPALRDQIRRLLASHPHPGVVADLLTHHCVPDLYSRQCILAEVDVCRRVRLVQIQLAQMTACPSLRPLRRFR